MTRDPDAPMQEFSTEDKPQTLERVCSFSCHTFNVVLYEEEQI
jgi:hypothetical protein